MDWNDDPDPTEAAAGTSRRPSPGLLVLASLPWLIVVGLLVLPARTPTGPDPVAAPEPGPVAEVSASGSAGSPSVSQGSPGTADVRPPEEDRDTPGIRPADEPTVAGRETGDPATALTLTELQGRWRSEPGEEEAISLAVVGARAWLTGVDPILEVGDLRPAASGGYAEHLVVEAVERPEAGALVVTVVAVVLDTGGDTTTASARRIAVPVAETPSGARLAGEPWELPPPVLAQTALERRPVTDPVDLEAARTALQAAGLTTWELVGLHDTGAWPVIAEVVGVQDDGGAGADTPAREIWLRRHLGGFAVAGAPLTRPSEGEEAVS